MGVITPMQLPAGFFYRGAFVPCKPGPSANSNEVRLDAMEFAGSHAIVMENRSQFLIAGIFARESKPLSFRDALMAHETFDEGNGTYFEAQGNAVWGVLRGATLRIEGASINRAHLLPYLWRRLLFRHGIFSVTATLPRSSPYRELFPVLNKKTTLWISWPEAAATRSVHFFAKGEQR